MVTVDSTRTTEVVPEIAERETSEVRLAQLVFSLGFGLGAFAFYCRPTSVYFAVKGFRECGFFGSVIALYWMPNRRLRNAARLSGQSFQASSA